MMRNRFDELTSELLAPAAHLRSHWSGVANFKTMAYAV